MIAQNELIEIKQRMLLASDVAKHLANSDGEFLELDVEQYQLVHAALEGLKGDCLRVLAELDILRGMFAQKVGAFFMEVANAGDRQGCDRGATVDVVPEPEDSGCGSGTRDDEAATGGRLHRGRAARKPRKRSQPRRNRKGNGGDQSELDARAGEGAMDCSPEA